MKPINVLFLCTGNSARSILAEALLTHLGAGRFKGFSAGSQPKGTPHPLALQVLNDKRISTDGLSSKSWDVFAAPGAPHMDFIITVCDNAANEVCPIWPGKPISAHWGLPDPAAATGPHDAQLQAFQDAFRITEARIAYFLTFADKNIMPDELQKKMKEAGHVG